MLHSMQFGGFKNRQDADKDTAKIVQLTIENVVLFPRDALQLMLGSTHPPPYQLYWKQWKRWTVNELEKCFSDH